MKPISLFGMLAISAACSAVFSSANAQTLVEFDFQNFSLGQVIGDASYVASGLTASFDMANNGVETAFFAQNKASVSRFVGLTNFPRLSFSTPVPISLDRIEFDHWHNHNPGFPTYPGYSVDLQIDRGLGFNSIASFVALPGNYVTESLAGPGLLPPGPYSLRWLVNVSPDTNTEFFGLDNIRLVQNPVPGPLPLLGTGMGYAFSRKLRRRIRSV